MPVCSAWVLCLGASLAWSAWVLCPGARCGAGEGEAGGERRSSRKLASRGPVRCRVASGLRRFRSAASRPRRSPRTSGMDHAGVRPTPVGGTATTPAYTHRGRPSGPGARESVPTRFHAMPGAHVRHQVFSGPRATGIFPDLRRPGRCTGTSPPRAGFLRLRLGDRWCSPAATWGGFARPDEGVRGAVHPPTPPPVRLGRGVEWRDRGYFVHRLPRSCRFRRSNRPGWPWPAREQGPRHDCDHRLLADARPRRSAVAAGGVRSDERSTAPPTQGMTESRKDRSKEYAGTCAA
jgi:hypothetical protein